MLTLMGLGLWDEKDITLREIEEAKKADKVYIEFYTSKWNGDIKKLEDIIGKRIKVLERSDLEEDSDKILDSAKREDIIVFVLGDPLAATMHISLLTEAKKRKIKIRVFHNASIFSAVAETGLSLYKFGKTATVPFPRKTGEIPLSVYETIEGNMKRGLHTLLLLDVVSKKKVYMKPDEALKILLEIENKEKRNVFSQDSKVVVLSRVGSDNPLIVYGKVKYIQKGEFGNPPSVLVVPSQLHFAEKDFLKTYCND